MGGLPAKMGWIPAQPGRFLENIGKQPAGIGDTSGEMMTTPGECQQQQQQQQQQ
jgi:hypothetical protein